MSRESVLVEPPIITQEAKKRAQLLSLDPFGDEFRREWFEDLVTPLYYDNGKVNTDYQKGPQVQFAHPDLVKDSLPGIARVPLTFEKRIGLELETCRLLGKKHPFEDKKAFEKFKKTRKFEKLLEAEKIWIEEGIIPTT